MGLRRFGPVMVGLVIIGSLTLVMAGRASAHRSGCHRWHSCPSDTGSYTCGDLGYTSECGGTTGSTNLTDTTVATLVVTGPSTVKVGEVIVFQTTATNAAGVNVYSFPTWTASSGSISYGVWTAPKKAGTYTITATANGVTGSFVITVLPSSPSSVVLEADSATVSAGTPLPLRVTVTDAYGNAIPDVNAVWTVEGVGEIRNGVFSSTKVGSTTVSVRTNGLTARKTIQVNPGPARVITILPRAATVSPGETVSFRASAADDFGNAVESPTVKWTATGGSITTGGVFKAADAVASGEVRVTLSTPQGSLTASAVITIAGATKGTPAITPPTAPRTSADAGGSVRPTTPEAGTVTDARLRVIQRLNLLLQTGAIQKTSARQNLQFVVASLIKETQPAATDRDALTQIESALSDGTVEKTPAHLDILAEVQARLGKKSDARTTLRARLAMNPLTGSAYRALLALEAEAGEHQDLDTFVNGKKIVFDVRPVIRTGQTLVPVRALVEALGATVFWNPEAQTITVHRGETTVLLQIGSDQALVNGKEVLMSVPAISENGRTMIPARFVAEGFGLNVTWLSEERAIIVTEAPLVE